MKMLRKSKNIVSQQSHHFSCLAHIIKKDPIILSLEELTKIKYLIWLNWVWNLMKLSNLLQNQVCQSMFILLSFSKVIFGKLMKDLKSWEIFSTISFSWTKKSKALKLIKWWVFWFVSLLWRISAFLWELTKYKWLDQTSWNKMVKWQCKNLAPTQNSFWDDQSMQTLKCGKRLLTFQNQRRKKKTKM